ncbi:Glutaredoxin [Raineyella antarctica]|uniref:Glutaredoxin n=1 Tax=Raineyella antarctica TaxID=1577474 RepID=A0A1G6GER5_9ACTN|nr:hypothetical protein [Raineyella antarctica]SDB80460.1 Glutaredoxin [Raineyella antarctica]
MTDDETGAVGGPAVLTIVEAQACHFCADANRALAELGLEFPMVVERVDARSREGRALLQELRAPMTPLVLLDGWYFSSGRLPRRKLQRLLRNRTRTAA